MPALFCLLVPRFLIKYLQTKWERTMEYILSLNEEIDDIIRKKLSICNCNPCTCTKRKKDKYFQELKDILARFNNEYLRIDLLGINY